MHLGQWKYRKFWLLSALLKNYTNISPLFRMIVNHSEYQCLILSHCLNLFLLPHKYHDLEFFMTIASFTIRLTLTPVIDKVQSIDYCCISEVSVPTVQNKVVCFHKLSLCSPYKIPQDKFLCHLRLYFLFFRIKDAT